MVCYAAVNEYALFNNGGLYEVAYTVLFFTILYEMLDLIREIRFAAPLKCVIQPIAIVVACAMLFSLFADNILKIVNRSCEQEYSQALGGYTNMANDLKRSASIVGDQSVFSTYASGLEVLVNQFQPSGTDYIIHALGDRAREDYLNSFYSSDCKYVTTIKEEYSGWEYWIRSANWFFYRELYQRYHPVASSRYQVIWEQNDEVLTQEADIDTNIEIIQVDDANIRVILSAERPINGFADIKLTYNSTPKASLRSKFIFQKMVSVKSATTQWNIRANGEEYLPIEIVNGVGEITLTSQPEVDTMVTVSDAECSKIYTVPFDYLEIGGEAIASNEVCKVNVERTEKNERIIKDLIALDTGDEQLPVLNIAEIDNYFQIDLAYNNIHNLNNQLTKNNFCRVVKNGYNGQFRASSLTDLNWTNGIAKTGDTILFNFSDQLLQALSKANMISSGDKHSKIIGIYHDDYWSHVQTEGQANWFQFPGLCSFS